MRSSLPQPDADSERHSQRCAAFIREQIDAAGGCISFAEFMQHALYAPGLGYYVAGARKFGAQGDFVTAPEVSPLFAKVLARQCAEVMAQCATASILEIGAGSGRLCVDLLVALEALDALPERYLILDVSADLAERQQALLQEAVPALQERVEWLDALPDQLDGVIVANEVLDALPVERFVQRDVTMQQRVRLAGQRFELFERAAGDALQAAVADIVAERPEAFAPGYTSEVSLAAPGWIADLVGSLGTGVAFLFDYGLSRREYYAADRAEGWLRCHFRHHAHDNALLYPGIQDITAWVDFTRVAEAADAAGATVAGFVDQAHFLLNSGLGDVLQTELARTPGREVELSGQVKLLTLPSEMGENFKCLGLSRGDIATPSAFNTADRTHTL